MEANKPRTFFKVTVYNNKEHELSETFDFIYPEDGCCQMVSKQQFELERDGIKMKYRYIVDVIDLRSCTEENEYLTVLNIIPDESCVDTETINSIREMYGASHELTPTDLLDCDISVPIATEYLDVHPDEKFNPEHDGRFEAVPDVMFAINWLVDAYLDEKCTTQHTCWDILKTKLKQQ